LPRISTLTGAATGWVNIQLNTTVELQAGQTYRLGVAMSVAMTFGGALGNCRFWSNSFEWSYSILTGNVSDEGELDGYFEPTLYFDNLPS
jgi:hypothetical protein